MPGGMITCVVCFGLMQLPVPLLKITAIGLTVHL